MNISSLRINGWGWLVVFLFSTAGASAAEFTRHIEKSFAVTPDGKLVVRADRGTIEITTTQLDGVDVRVFRTLKETSKEKADELFAEHEVDVPLADNTVTVTAHGKSELDEESTGVKPREQSFDRLRHSA